MRTVLLSFAAAVLASGCVTTTDNSYAVPALHKQAAFDLACPERQLQIMETSQNTYGVVGCDKRTAYALDGCDTASRECRFRRTAPITSSPG